MGQHFPNREPYWCVLRAKSFSEDDVQTELLKFFQKLFLPSKYDLIFFWTFEQIILIGMELSRLGKLKMPKFT